MSQYFWPEVFSINDLVLQLEADGHEVTVITGKPNYPKGEIFDGYSQQGINQEVFGKNITVFRLPLRPRHNGGGLNLVRNYLSFVFNGCRHIRSLVKRDEFDAIFVYAPSPILSAIPAIFAKWKTGAPLSIWVQDLWPESIDATGFIKNRLAIYLVRQLVKLIYSAADQLLVQSPAFSEPVQRLAHADKIQYYPNSHLDLIQEQQVPLKNGELDTLLTDHFCVVFAGNIGTAQNLESVIAAAVHLKQNPQIKILLVGAGSMRAQVMAEASAKGLDNLILPGRVTPAELPYLYGKAGALLVSLSDQPIFRLTIPSKLQGYFSAAKPIIACMTGVGAEVVKESDAGIAVDADDVSGLSDAILSIYHLSTEEREQLGQNGRAYYLEHFERSTLSQRLVSLLSRLTRQSRD
ncbi:MAG: glycosyltransferase family 4 protein [Candidatus Polarisedimenticolaceae bacterium]|nr:glycosyltransferase family 4 protein [Candidatus Polarisedimenticolaceae bacterium]